MFIKVLYSRLRSLSHSLSILSFSLSPTVNLKCMVQCTMCKNTKEEKNCIVLRLLISKKKIHWQKKKREMCSSKCIGSIIRQREEIHDQEEMNYLVKFGSWEHPREVQCQHYADYAVSCWSVGIKTNYHKRIKNKI